MPDEIEIWPEREEVEELLIDLDEIEAEQDASDDVLPTEHRKAVNVQVDVYLLLVVSALLVIGLMMVFSTTFDWSYQEYGSPLTIFWQQVRNVVIGLVVMVLLAYIDYRRWRMLSVPMMGLVIVGLIVLLAVGDEIFGARRAFYRGSIQPGEAAELAVIIYMAAWLASKQKKLRRLSYGLLPFSILVGVVVSLIAMQPDLSTALLILVTTVAMFFLAGADVFQLLLSGGVMMAVVWTSSTQLEYAHSRLTSYLASINDLRQASWHVQQAVIAFLNGGWFGVGLGQGRQKFGFLPAPHTDSIFAVIGEELGLVGCFIVVLLFVVLAQRGFSIARRAPDAFGALLAAGITCWLVVEALLNVAVMTAALPFTGVPLPFISFGGSSLVVSMAGIGLMLSISRQAAKGAIPERKVRADIDFGRGDWRRRLPRAGRSRGVAA